MALEVLPLSQPKDDAMSEELVEDESEMEELTCPDCLEVLVKSYNWDMVGFVCDNCGNIIGDRHLLGIDWS